MSDETADNQAADETTDTGADASGSEAWKELVEKARLLAEETTRVGRETYDKVQPKARAVGADAARHGQRASSELAKHLASLERKLGEVEEGLRRHEEAAAADAVEDAEVVDDD